MQKHGNVFKNWLCPNFLLLPKKSELPIVWGGAAAPLAPPGPYAYEGYHMLIYIYFSFLLMGTVLRALAGMGYFQKNFSIPF